MFELLLVIMAKRLHNIFKGDFMYLICFFIEVDIHIMISQMAIKEP